MKKKPVLQYPLQPQLQSLPSPQPKTTLEPQKMTKPPPESAVDRPRPADLESTLVKYIEDAAIYPRG